MRGISSYYFAKKVRSFTVSAWRGALGLGLLAGTVLASCQRQSEQGGGANTTPEATQQVPVDSAKIKHLAMQRDSLKADSIAKKNGQLPGAILPGHRIVAFYGNIRSKGMGILGREPKAQMLRKFDGVLKEWQAADPSIPVMPALHSVTITAQGAPGADGMWRLMNSKSTIEETRAWAREKNALLFLDVQPGWSDLEHELPKLTEYLKDPMVMLGIDPEFSLKTLHVRP
ncbi:hypothetical protein I3A86_23880, partial [Salmonella enterica]|nr:hypothetical protein [Salmonella enterica]